MAENDNLLIVGAVLAGGEGRRMDGRDKGLLAVQEKPMVLCVMQALALQCDQVLVNANRNLSDYRAYGCSVITDNPNFPGLGPLGGILALSEFLDGGDSTHLLISPCDTPYVSVELFAALRSAIQKKPKSGVFVESQSGTHPLHAILPLAGLSRALRTFLSGNKPKVMDFYRTIQMESMVWKKEEELENLNHSAQLMSKNNRTGHVVE